MARKEGLLFHVARLFLAVTFGAHSGNVFTLRMATTSIHESNIAGIEGESALWQWRWYAARRARRARRGCCWWNGKEKPRGVANRPQVTHIGFTHELG